MKAIPYLFLLLPLAAPHVAAAQELVWAADAEGGAPYSFRDPRNPSRIIGFEVDFADALAQRMGRKPRFVQNQWDGLVPGLERAQYDVVINGLEIAPEGFIFPIRISIQPSPSRHAPMIYACIRPTTCAASRLACCG